MFRLYSEFKAGRTSRPNEPVSSSAPRQPGDCPLRAAPVWQDHSRRGQFARGDEAQYFDLEDPVSQRRAHACPRDLRGLVLIDEIQRQPESFPVLRVLADPKPLPARFLILGRHRGEREKTMNGTPLAAERAPVGTGRPRRILEGTLAVAVWTALGEIFHLSPNAYLLAGVPITLLFQAGVRRVPVWSMWSSPPPAQSVAPSWWYAYVASGAQRHVKGRSCVGRGSFARSTNHLGPALAGPPPLRKAQSRL